MIEKKTALQLSRRFPSKRAFITGSGSGLGRELAIILAVGGWRLGLADLSLTGLEQTKALAIQEGAGDVELYQGDVASENFVNESLLDFAKAFDGIDMLVNNAGVAAAGAVDSVPPEDWHWIVETNLLGVVWGCRSVIPIMKKQRQGLIVNVSSAAGFASAPRMGPYNVTKAGVISLSETLAGELSEYDMQVSCAMLGFFQSNLLAKMRAPKREKVVARRLMENSGYDANQAAVAIIQGVARGKLYIVWPFYYSALWWVKRMVPRWFTSRTQRLTATHFDESSGLRYDE
jgi:NAD(P)-dependent dehydrogenase (short-subunit alcohol dehydrogenase family)